MKYILLLFFIFISTILSAQNPVKVLVEKMLKANEQLHSSKFTLYTEERMIDGKIMVTERLVKMKTRPKKIYFYSITPNPGTEILWSEGWNEDKMMVSPKSFPYVTFSMHLNNPIARKDSHHSIVDLGFEYVSGIVEHYVKKYKENFYSYVKITDTVNWNNRSCIVVKVDFADFKYLDYTVQPNEDVMDIAVKKYLNDYSILMANPELDDYKDVKAGQVIKIPNFYCRNIIFFIDRLTWLPLKQEMYDEKGLYERYEMKSFIPNPTFKPEEFTPEYSEYKF
jgi:outer membrane lipoprotein-sorting protein